MTQEFNEQRFLSRAFRGVVGFFREVIFGEGSSLTGNPVLTGDPTIIGDPTITGDVTVTGVVSSDKTKLKNASTGVWENAVVDTEYISPNQHGSIYGTVIRTYFGSSLPSYLTTGNNVAKIVDSVINFSTAFPALVGRYVTTGFQAHGAGEECDISISSDSGNGNLLINTNDVTVLSGWVDYIKA
jgi:hypothetical protein